MRKFLYNKGQKVQFVKDEVEDGNIKVYEGKIVFIKVEPSKMFGLIKEKVKYVIELDRINHLYYSNTRHLLIDEMKILGVVNVEDFQ